MTRGPRWSPEEDAQLRNAVAEHTFDDWVLWSDVVLNFQQRSPKAVQARWKRLQKGDGA